MSPLTEWLATLVVPARVSERLFDARLRQPPFTYSRPADTEPSARTSCSPVTSPPTSSSHPARRRARTDTTIGTQPAQNTA